MNNIQTVTVNDTNISIKEYHGKRVVTFKDIDLCHGRPEGTARKRFNDNKQHFIESEDFFKVPYSEIIESPLGGRSIIDVPGEIESYKGRDYAGFIFIAQDLNNGYWKIGRTATKRTAEKRLNLSRTYHLHNYEYFECVDTLKADKAIQAELKSYKVKNSWYDGDRDLFVNTINRAIKEVTESYEPRKKHKGGFHGDITLITESGYLMLVKSFTDDLAWQVQRQLVNTYFRVSEETNTKLLELQIKQERARAMYLNAVARFVKATGKQYEDIGLSPIAVDTMKVKAAEKATGADLGNYLPQTEKSYSATDIAKEIGCSANKIGKTANAYGLKTEEYGVFVMDKSRHSSKEMPNFRYNEKGRQKLREIFGLTA